MVDAALGSSIVSTDLDECFDTVSETVVANAVGRPSAVTNSDLACARSLSLILWKSITLSAGNLQASHSRYHFFFAHGIAEQGYVFQMLQFL